MGRGGGDGGARGTRGIGRPRGRGAAGGPPSGIPSARGKIPSVSLVIFLHLPSVSDLDLLSVLASQYSSVKSSGYGPPVTKKKAV